MKCLLIELKDKRKFFTQEKNLPQLLEFCKSFKASIKVVQMTGGEVFDLEKLVFAICDPSIKTPKVEYQIVETKIAASKRQETLTLAKKIQKFIAEQFIKRKNVSMKLLKEKYKTLGLSDAALCNHLKKVKTNLEQQGLRITKIGAGTYKVA